MYFAVQPEQWRSVISKSSKSSAHYVSDINRIDVSNKGPSSGISVCVWGGGGLGKHACFYTSEYIKNNT